MLQKYYGYHGSGDTLTGEVHQQTRYIGRRGTSSDDIPQQARVRSVSVWVRACIRVRAYIYKLGRCELEAGSCELEAASWYESWLQAPKNYRLWIQVTRTDFSTYQRDFTTAKEMKNEIERMNKDYLVCEEHYRDEGENGHHWFTHHGRIVTG